MTPEWPDANYRKTFNRDWDGNPLIECLPPVKSVDDFLRSVSSAPSYSLDERALPGHLRRHFVARLGSFITPSVEMVRTHAKLEVALRSGYVSRNPRNINHLKMMYGKSNEGRSKHNTPPICMLMTGLSGTGKSTILESVLGLYPQVIVHRGIAPGIDLLHQLVWMKVDCPHDASLKGLCLAIGRKVDSLLGTHYHDEWSASRSSIDGLIGHVAILMRNLSVGVLVLDELQHLRTAKVGGDAKFLNFLVNLINEVGVPIVFVGTYTLEGILSEQMRNARRATGEGTITIPRLERTSPMWSVFVKEMWAYQWVANPAPLSVEIENALYDCTQGLRDGIVKLFMSAQNRALETGSETVDAEVLRQTYDVDFQPMHPVISLLRQGADDRDPRFDELLKGAWHGSHRNDVGENSETSVAEEKKAVSNGQRKRPIDPTKCDRPAGLLPCPHTNDPVGTDLRNVGNEAYRELSKLGLISDLSDQSSALHLGP